MERSKYEFAVFIGFHDANIGNHHQHSSAAYAAGLAFLAPVQIASRGHEINFFGEAPLLVGCHQVTPVGPGCNFLRPARAGQARLRMGVILADHCGIDVAKFIDLCAAHETDVHIAALEI